jgi:hypothetical protein
MVRFINILVAVIGMAAITASLPSALAAPAGPSSPQPIQMLRMSSTEHPLSASPVASSTQSRSPSIHETVPKQSWSERKSEEMRTRMSSPPFSTAKTFAKGIKTSVTTKASALKQSFKTKHPEAYEKVCDARTKICQLVKKTPARVDGSQSPPSA